MRFLSTATAFLSCLIAATSAAPLSNEAQAECSDVHFIAARGSGEAPGVGFLRTFVQSVSTALPDLTITSEGVEYPAYLNFSNILAYVPSQSDGVNAAKSQTTAYAKQCPKSKIVLTGISQGADVAGSAVCGGGSIFGITPSIAPLGDDVGSHVVAVVLFGDPRFVKGMPFNKGTAKNQGIIPHTARQTCKPYVSRIVSYCDTGDPFCDGGNQFAAHAGVLRAHQEEATKFTVDKIKSLSVPVKADA